MPIDLRYHAVSLIAVFMALLLGVLIGFAALDPGQQQQYLKQQRAILAEVKKDNERTRLENKQKLEDFAAQDKINHDFEQAIVPVVIKDRLLGRRVVILLDEESIGNAPAGGLTNILEDDARAKIAAVITLRPQLAKLTREQVVNLLERRGLVCPPDHEPRAFMASRFGKRLAEAGSNFAAFLEDEGLIRIAPGSDLSRPISSAVMIGGSAPSSDMTQQIEQPLLLALKGAGVKVVGCEHKKDSGAAVDFFQQLKLPTVDCVDTYPGQVALVLLLADDNLDGNYGVKHSADRLLPEVQ